VHRTKETDQVVKLVIICPEKKGPSTALRGRAVIGRGSRRGGEAGKGSEPIRGCKAQRIIFGEARRTNEVAEGALDDWTNNLGCPSRRKGQSAETHSAYRSPSLGPQLACRTQLQSQLGVCGVSFLAVSQRALELPSVEV